MKFVRPLFGMLRSVLLALRLALPKIGVGWMFALLASNFNRITIVELGITAVVVTVLIGMHNFLSPFQLVFGRMADRRPILGFRRTPYLLLGALLAGLVFVALPPLAVAMSGGNSGAYLATFALLVVFGVAQAVMGDAHHALIAEVTTPRNRGWVISIVWTFTIISAIAAAIVFKVMMPTYSAEAMQRLYNLTPLITLGTALVGVLGMERRLRGDDMTRVLETARGAIPAGGAFRAALRILQTNTQVRAFFAFMLVAILAIFLQDAILEVFGADVFGMSVAETTSFTQVWGGGVLLGMLLSGILSSIITVNKKVLALAGGGGIALGLGMLTVCALIGQRSLLNPSLMLMGLFTGLFNVGALSMMMEMTVEGATGLYMGLWGTAQALGTGLAAIVSGALRSLLVETHLLAPAAGYGAIFGVETVLMVISIAILSTVSLAHFHGLSPEDVTHAMEAGATV